MVLLIMSDTISCESRKFTPLELKPKWSIRVCHTPNKGRDYYTVSYYDEFGKRQRKLFPDQSTAEGEAEKLQAKMNRGIAPGILLNGRVWVAENPSRPRKDSSE